MSRIGMGGAVRAAVMALVCCAGGTAATASERSAAATVWELRSGLNVAALACRGADEAAIVAGYNRLLADHRGELAEAYRATADEYAGAAAFDTAMTRLYNNYAQPAAQAALCANAAGVLDALAVDGAPLAGRAEAALGRLAGGPPAVQAQVALASIPQILDTRAAGEVEHGLADEE